MSLPDFPLYTATEAESIAPRFLVSCLLRCSGFSAAVQGRRGRLRGGGKRECAGGGEEGGGGAGVIGRLESIVGLYPTDKSEQFRIIQFNSIWRRLNDAGRITDC